MICAFLSSLRIFDEIELNDVQRRSLALRDRFMNSVSNRASFVGIDSDHSGTSMVTIEPADGSSWSTKHAGLRTHFFRRDMYPLVLQFADNPSWVRVAFPYFLDVSDVDRLGRAVDEVLVEAP
jgi:selenocysteine lyase/cysteine desulfurase